MKRTESGLSVVLGQVREQLRKVGGGDQSAEQRDSAEADDGGAAPAGDTGDGAVASGGAANGAVAVPRKEVERLRQNGRETEAEIVELVAENGGKIPQQEIVEHVALSESTVSRRLTEMEHAELVERFSIGRENLVYLPDAIPDGFAT